MAERIGATDSYAFEREAEYYADLQASRFGVTAKRTGWDALRHYELAANGCVPCFRQLERKPPPVLRTASSPAAIASATRRRGLAGQVDAVDEGRYAELQRGALDWARANSTRERARAFLDQLGFPAS